MHASRSYQVPERIKGFRQIAGAGFVVAGLSILLAQQVMSVLATPAVVLAVKGGLMCALATAIGALPVLTLRRIPVRVADVMLGFGAGVMLAATAFSLVLPGLDAARDLGFGNWGAGALMSAGIGIGVLALRILDRVVPHSHFEQPQGSLGMISHRVWLFVLAITLHNVPEGLAVGVAAGGASEQARGLATGIALQNIPEGLSVALVLASAGLGRGMAALAGALTGLVEPVFALIGGVAVGVSVSVLPWGLAFAAGAMLFAISHEVIPESHRNGHQTDATYGLIVGFCVMMLLDTALA